MTDQTRDVIGFAGVVLSYVAFVVALLWVAGVWS